MIRPASSDRGVGTNLIHLLPIGETNAALLDFLREPLASEFAASCQVLNPPLDPSCAFHAVRQQYFSTEILARMRDRVAPGCWRLLGITSLDLYIPILTFVFGEAQLDDACALVSTHRLRQEFYGLPPDPERLRVRLLKEAVHELGHTLSLAHCDDYRCAMAPSHAVEWIDIKGDSLCPACRSRADLGT